MSDSLFPGKRVALVHDWLNGMRGGEKVLEAFCDIFPEADIYTLLHEPGKLSAKLEARKIRTSFIQQLPFSFQSYRHYLPLFPMAIEAFDLSSYDIVLSSSHCVAKGARHGGEAFHASYLHAPMRYMWHLFPDYFAGPEDSRAVYWAARAVRPYLRRWDRRSSQRVDAFFCNSANVRRQIETLYGREAKVIHAPVDSSFYCPGEGARKDYYLIVSAFAPNKRIDLAIEAFNAAKRPLKIVGSGQDEARCRALAGETVEFLGNVDDARIRTLYREARAFVFPGEDDFGITPLEAQASGTPVIAYARGGALETVVPETGIFFQHPSAESLREAIDAMEIRAGTFNSADCVAQAARFGRDRFIREIEDALREAHQVWTASRT